MNSDSNNRDFTLAHSSVIKTEKRNNHHDNKEDKQVVLLTQDNEREDRGATLDEDFNDSTKVIITEAEKHLISKIFCCVFVSKFIQMAVVLALLILAIQWQPLHQLLLKHKDPLFIISTVLSACFIVLPFSEKLSTFLHERSILTLLIHMIYMVIFYCFMDTFYYGFYFSDFSPIWVVLAAVAVTADYLLLSVLVYFKRVNFIDTFIDGAKYTNAATVALLVLIFSQLYYLCWYAYVKFSDHDQQEILMVTPSILYYPHYMFNVCVATTMATVAIWTSVVVPWELHYLKRLECKAGMEIPLESLRVLGDDDTLGAESQPFNL